MTDLSGIPHIPRRRDNDSMGYSMEYGDGPGGAYSDRGDHIFDAVRGGGRIASVLKSDSIMGYMDGRSGGAGDARELNAAKRRNQELEEQLARLEGTDRARGRTTEGTPVNTPRKLEARGARDAPAPKETLTDRERGRRDEPGGGR
jgi:hypothetical protein